MQGSKAQPPQIRLLEAASELLMREGIGGLRVDEVAKVAGCNKRLIYHYFTNKDGLGRAVLWAQVILLSTLDPVQSRFPPLSQRALRFLKDFFHQHGIARRVLIISFPAVDFLISGFLIKP